MIFQMNNYFSNNDTYVKFFFIKRKQQKQPTRLQKRREAEGQSLITSRHALINSLSMMQWSQLWDPANKPSKIAWASAINGDAVGQILAIFPPKQHPPNQLHIQKFD